MKFVIEYRYEPSVYLAGLKRFAETQGPPPAGITMLGRWHSAAAHKGYILAEATDAKAIYAWALNWADLASFEMHSVLEDAEFAEVITAHFKQ